MALLGHNELRFWMCWYFQDYVFSLLTGYADPPEGIELREGQYYNPYFTGGALAMAQQLYSEGVEYDDGMSYTWKQCFTHLRPSDSYMR